jgi:hypothetical protein
VSVSKQVFVSLSGDATYEVDFSVSGSVSDNKITLNMAAGDSATSFVVTIINDEADELSETALFTIEPQSGFDIGNPAVFSLTIEDNDIPTVAFSEKIASAEEGSGPYAIQLKLSTPPVTDEQVIIWFTDGLHVKYGDDYEINPMPTGHKITVMIPAGSTEGQFFLTPLLDRKRENHWEYVAFYMTEASSGLVRESPLASIFTITDKKRHPHFSVSPNPVQSQFRLVAEEVDEHETLFVEIRNSQGERVFKEKGTLQEINEKISRRFRASRKGIYLMTVMLDNENYLIRIFKD